MEKLDTVHHHQMVLLHQSARLPLDQIIGVILVLHPHHLQESVLDLETESLPVIEEDALGRMIEHDLSILMPKIARYPEKNGIITQVRPEIIDAQDQDQGRHLPHQEEAVIDHLLKIGVAVGNIVVVILEVVVLEDMIVAVVDDNRDFFLIMIVTMIINK